MKIGFLTSEYPSNKFGSSGGIGTSIYGLCKGLLLTNNTPVVIIYGQPKDKVFQEEGITFYCVKNVKFKGLSWWFTRKKIEKLINQLYEENIIDLVEAPDWTGITSFVKPKKCPILIRLNGSDTYFCHLDNRPVKLWNKFHEKNALKKANKHVSVSKFTADLTNKLFGLNIDFEIVPNGVNSKDFTNSNRDVKPLTILYFGTLIRKKGLLELPLIFNEIVKVLPEAKLILVGRDAPDISTKNNSTWDMMKDLFSKKAIENVEYVGGVPYDKVKQYIEEAAVCVFPSFAEALPVSWLEAMSMKKAIVASNIGWSKEVIQDGEEGFLVNPKEHLLYANQIIKLLKPDEFNSAFGENALEKVMTTFESKKVIEKNLLIYQSVIDSN